MLDKSTLISYIQKFNRTARTDWLEGFDEYSLRLYLDHLEQAREPRGAASYWLRTGETPPLMEN